MVKNIFKKSIIVAIIALFIGASVTPNLFVKNVRADITDELIAYWSFDDENDIGHDDSGNGHQGTNHGATSISNGISGRALSFDGVDDYIDIPETSDFKFTNQDLTFTCWITIPDNIDNYKPFIALGGTDND